MKRLLQLLHHEVMQHLVRFFVIMDPVDGNNSVGQQVSIAVDVGIRKVFLQMIVEIRDLFVGDERAGLRVNRIDGQKIKIGVGELADEGLIAVEVQFHIIVVVNAEIEDDRGAGMFGNRGAHFALSVPGEPVVAFSSGSDIDAVVLDGAHHAERAGIANPDAEMGRGRKRIVFYEALT